MNDSLLHIEFTTSRSLQEQLREYLMGLIHQGHFNGQPLPSCRKLSSMLKVSRNTVVIVYEKLVDEGYLVSKQRSGFFVNDVYTTQVCELHSRTNTEHEPELSRTRNNALNWNHRIARNLTQFDNIKKPGNWQEFEYPFIFGQPDHTLFPLQQWRECCRLAQRHSVYREWLTDSVDRDDPFLIEQLQKSVLSKRGIIADEDEILITIGTQNSIYLLADLLVKPGTKLGMEDPGYPDVRNIFSWQGADILPLKMDHQGIETGQQLHNCDYVYATPSHQAPTNVTMSMLRRRFLLEQAENDDLVIIEDDYDSEVNILEQPHPALKSMDNSGRVIYVGSLSKSLSPGLRLGFIVADKALILQLRMLRRLMYRHPPTNNQRTTALFISMGYYDSYLRRLKKSYVDKWRLMRQALETYLPECITPQSIGGSSFWLKVPDQLSVNRLTAVCAENGVLVEPGDVHFRNKADGSQFIRLGFSAIPCEKITKGIKKLASIVKSVTTNKPIWL